MVEWIAADEAAETLNVRRETLYAYVSRGRVRAEPDPADPRKSRYRASDVAALAVRRGRSRRPSAVAAEAIAWGEPVLASAITTIIDGRLFYRGRDAVTLAETESLESVARLLRGGHGVALKSAGRPDPPPAATIRERAFAVLAARSGGDPPSRGRAQFALAAEAVNLLDVFADAAAKDNSAGLIHERLARAWGCDAPGGDLIRRTLVLLADHELNASTFCARVAASTGASLAAACLAGLAALSGPLHGGMAGRVWDFLGEAEREGPRAAVAARLARGAAMPGFGHPLYPAGDPRCAAMLAAFTPKPAVAGLKAAVEAATGVKANVDFSLVALSDSLALPKDAPFALFAVARCAGWIAHALEQVSTGSLIRPRARYIGVEPDA